MHGKIHTIVYAAIAASCLGICQAQQASSEGLHIFTTHAAYVGDVLSNVRGGAATGTCYLGMASFSAALEAPEGGPLAGGRLFVKTVNTHGALPSEVLTGDYQGLSNIAAGDHSYVQEAWVAQSFETVRITIGLQDMNTNFAVNEYSGMYLNSSFGIHSTIATNVTSPIFPLTSFGGTLQWSATERFTLLASVFDGAPIDFDHNPRNLRWHFSPHDGIFAVAEVQTAIGSEGGKRGTIKVGAYDHHHEATGAPEPLAAGDANKYGIYFTYDQLVAGTATASGGIAVFARGSVSSRHCNENFLFAGAGINYFGVFNDDGSDVAGIAVARAVLREAPDETALEMTYTRMVADGLMIQPDVQYILNPSGAGSALRNCLVCTMRFSIGI